MTTQQRRGQATVHQKPRSRGAHEQIAPLGAISSPDSHGHERSFVGGLASDEKLAGSGQPVTEKGREEGVVGERGRRKKKEERREIGKKKKKIFFKKYKQK